MQWLDSDLHQDHDTYPILSETPEDRWQDVPAEHLPKASSYHSQGHSAIQRLNCPEITPLSKSITILRSILLIPGKVDVATELLDHRLHSRRLLRRQVIPRFKRATTLIPM